MLSEIALGGGDTLWQPRLDRERSWKFNLDTHQTSSSTSVSGPMIIGPRVLLLIISFHGAQDTCPMYPHDVGRFDNQNDFCIEEKHCNTRTYHHSIETLHL
jgi:hypothetical protein